jgi:hypothetical protein
MLLAEHVTRQAASTDDVIDRPSSTASVDLHFDFSLEPVISQCQ